MSACPRRWEAEAVEDGRLDGAGRASFERHTGTCSACSREVEMLAQLRAAGELPLVPLRSMDRRRRRAALLWHANQEILGMPRRARARRVGAFAATLLIVGAGFAEWRGWQVGRQAPTRALAPSGLAATAEPFRDLQRMATAEEGRLDADGHAPRTTGPAMGVSPAADAIAETDTGRDAAKARAASRKKRGAARVRRPWEVPAGGAAATAPEPRAPEADPPAAPTAEPVDGAAGALFASAMNAFDDGAYQKADELFHRFAQRFSGDPRAEDASFLRVVCALRRGDRVAVEAHAREYLGQHPLGLRRHEVERLIY